MSDFIIHSVPGSPYGRTVLAIFEEKGVGYAISPLPPGGGRSEANVRRHPFGRIPVLDHGDFRLYETQAIARYLDRILPHPALTPAEPRAAACMDQVMNICDWYLFQGVNNVIGFHRIIGPQLLGLPTDEAAIAEAMPRAHVVFDELSRLLGDQQFLAGEAVSLADMMTGPHLDFLSETPEWTVLTAKTPNLTAWLKRMNARPSMQATTWERVTAMAQAA